MSVQLPSFLNPPRNLSEIQLYNWDMAVAEVYYSWSSLSSIATTFS